MKRRRFLALLGSGVAAGAAALSFWQKPQEQLVMAPEPKRATFPAAHRVTLESLTETLLPAHAEFPGARALSVMTYLEQELARPEMEGTRRMFLRGATQLDRVARDKTGRTFAALEQHERELVVQAMLEGEGAAARFVPKDFVQSALALTLEGAFGDPQHGGNKDGAGWRALGYVMRPPTACVSGACEGHQ